jgi:ribosomal protein S18 acetylase RimI-like enzyme
VYNYWVTAITRDAASPYIRKVNVRRDLLAVADLIEICFIDTLDDDGREYLRQMRMAARDMNYLRWLQGAAERISAPLYGFVWEENGRIVGNLSFIPIVRGSKVTYLIANVAVHPEYRRRGIGTRLTAAAVDNLRERGIETAWLQVRDDNPAAHHLYLSLGFVERARRASWQASGPPLLDWVDPGGVTIQPRAAREWEWHERWLRRAYPPEVAWNLPLNIPRLSPQPFDRLLRWLRGEMQRNWSARRGDRPIGFVSWEPMRAATDTLWLAADPDDEAAAILSLLPYARQQLAGRMRPLQVNYPAGRAESAFRQAGFVNHQTLIWMSMSLNQPWN